MRMTLDHEYCLKADTFILGVAGEVNGREITFRGLEVTGATVYKIKFGLPDKTSFEDTITDSRYTIPADVANQVGRVQVQVIAANGTSMIRKSQILTMQVVDSIDYEPHEGTSPATGAQIFDLYGTTTSTTGTAGGINMLKAMLLTAPEDADSEEETTDEPTEENGEVEKVEETDNER